MKKIYFIGPYEKSLRVWYMKVSDDFDVSQTNKIRLGYNDKYEMRSQYLPKPYFSDNIDDLLGILKERKKKMIEEAYRKLYEVAMLNIPGEDEAYLHDSIDSPF